MILDPTPALLDNLYWITLFAVIVSSASAVLMAGFKQFDLFGKAYQWQGALPEWNMIHGISGIHSVTSQWESSGAAFIRELVFDVPVHSPLK